MKKRIYPLAFIVLLALFVLVTGLLSSCTPKSAKQIEMSNNDARINDELGDYQFNEFGVIKFFSGADAYNVTTVAIGDLDGDGDNDVIIANQDGSVIAMENVMVNKFSHYPLR